MAINSKASLVYVAETVKTLKDVRQRDTYGTLPESRNSTRSSKVVFSTLEICDIDSMQLLFCQLTFILVLSVFTCNVPQRLFSPGAPLFKPHELIYFVLYRVIIILFFERCKAVKGNIYQVFVFHL